MNSQIYSRRKLILFLGSGLIAAVGFTPNTLNAADKKYTALARCEQTGKTGQASSKILGVAKSKAVRACVKNGGIKGCCSVQWVRGPDGKKLKR